MRPTEPKDPFNRSLLNPNPQKPILPAFDAFQKYLQTYATAYNFKQQAALVRQNYKQLINRIHLLEHFIENEKIQREVRPPKSEESKEESKEHNKRHRRLNSEIQKHYICEEERCRKSYGTLGSLQQHQKLKHPDLFSSESRFKTPRQPTLTSLASPSKKDTPQPKINIQ